MVIFLILLLLSNLSVHCMEAPLHELKGAESETETESEFNEAVSSQNYGMPTAISDSEFDLTPRISSLMIAVGNNNYPEVKHLLAEAQKRGCLQAYVNLNCGAYTNIALELTAKFSFNCDKKMTALHLAADSDISSTILHCLLRAGANPNAQSEGGHTALWHALPSVWYDKKEQVTNSLKKVFFLHNAGANPEIGHPNEIPYDRIKEYCEDKNLSANMRRAYVRIKALFDAKIF